MIVDKLTKSAHFLEIYDSWEVDKLARIYIREMVWLNGELKDIVSDRDSRFQALFWKALYETFGEKLQFKNSYRPETYGQTKRVNDIPLRR